MIKLDLNVREWIALWSLLECTAETDCTDDYNLLQDVRRRMRNRVSIALKASASNNTELFNSWVIEQQRRIRELEHVHCDPTSVVLDNDDNNELGLDSIKSSEYPKSRNNRKRSRSRTK